MAFINKMSILIYDSTGSVHHFYEEGDTVRYIFADSITKKMEHMDLNVNVKEFDGFIDSDDIIYILCSTQDKKLILYEIISGDIRKRNLSEEISDGVGNINILGRKQDLHIIYTIRDKKERQYYTLMHSRLCGDEWENKEIARFVSSSILNEIKVFEEADGYFAAYAETDGMKGRVHLCRYDGVSWEKDFLSVEMNFEPYWFDIRKKQSAVDIVFTYENKGNFNIRYEMYDIAAKEKVACHELMEASSCMHPIFLNYSEEDWIIWIDYGSIASCKLSDDCLSYDGPFKWKESINSDFMLHKFSYNNEKVKEKLKMKCRRVFSIIPGYAMIGFGDYKIKAEQINSGKKKDGTKEIEELNDKEREADEICAEAQTFEKKDIGKIQDFSDMVRKINEMESRLENIERYLNRRKRTMFGR